MQAATSVLIVKKAPNLMIRKKSVFQVCFIIFFQQPSKITSILLYGLGTECALGSDCTTGQVCDASIKKCVTCKEGTQPDEKNEKCITSMFFFYFSFNNHQK